MIATSANAVQELLGWMFVISTVGCWIIWHVSRIRRTNLHQFEQAWQQKFEPNRPNVPHAPQWTETDAQTAVDDEYWRFMHQLPDDHLPANAAAWGPSTGPQDWTRRR